MKYSLSLLTSFVKTPAALGLLIFAVLVTGLVIKGQAVKAVDEVVIAQYDTVSQDIALTGKVKPASAVELSFERVGRIAAVYKNIGDIVKAGTVLVELEHADISSELAQTQATLKREEVILKALLQSTEPGALQIAERALTQAEKNVALARTTLFDTLKNTEIVAEEIIRTKIDLLFIDPLSENPQLISGMTDLSGTSISTGKVEVEKRLLSLKQSLALATSTNDMALLTARVKQDIAEIKLFLDNAAISIHMSGTSSVATSTSMSEWKTNVLEARTTVNSAITTLLTSYNIYTTSQAAYLEVGEEYAQAKTGANAKKIAVQQTKVSKIKADIGELKTRLQKAMIKAPMTGTIIQQTAHVGEIITAESPIVSVMTGANFQIEAYLKESDVAKLSVGQQATITLDAYGSEVVFNAHCVEIDTVETIINGEAVYATTFQFETSDKRIRSGMNAHVDVKGEKREHVLAIPERALTIRQGEYFVLLKVGEGDVREVAVTPGLYGFNGLVEIIQGLKEGDMVFVSTT